MRKWIGLVTVLVAGSVLAQSLPPGISPQMLQALKDMPPAQQAELARQYGITLPSSASARVNDSLGARGEPLVQGEYDLQYDPMYPLDFPVDEAPEQEGLSRFGADLFNREVSTFAPTDDAPVPETYRLGVGDQLLVQLFGKENEQLVLQVGRNGDVVFPKLGSISLAGLTFEDARALVKTRVEQQLIGVNAVISMGRLRAIGIFMAGEVSVPGSYSVSALTTVTQALFQAGGVSDIGSLRNIQVRRRGETVAVFDAYELLLQGDATGDIRLQSGDVIFVPPYKAIIEVAGEVKRPMIFELAGGETIESVLGMAGGFTQRAFPSLVVLTRLSSAGGLPAAINLDLTSADVLAERVVGGDILRIPSSGDQVSNSVSLEGAVTRAGEFGWYPGIRVSDLINDVRADLRLDADLSSALIVRYKNELLDIEVELFSIADAVLQQGSDKDPILKEFDRVLVFSLPGLDKEDGKADDLAVNTNKKVLESGKILQTDQKGSRRTALKATTLSGARVEAKSDYSRATLLTPILAKLRVQAKQNAPAQVVSISGAVQIPGDYPLTSGMTMEGLVKLAGGLKDSAYMMAAEIRRLNSQQGNIVPMYQDVSLARALDPRTSVVLQSRDHIMIRDIPDWSPRDAVTVSGEVRFPGEYLIQKGERLNDIIARAGGFTSEAFPEGAIFTREEVAKRESERARQFVADIRKTFATRMLTQETVSASIVDVAELTDSLESFEGLGRLLIDLPAALAGDSTANIEVMDGDVLRVPKFNRSVTVVGEVQQAGSHIFQQGYSVQDYLGLSAGLTERANDKAIYVVRANGSVRTLQQGWWRFSGTSVSMAPGDTIVVPVDTQYQETLASWREITQIIYQGLVSVAAVANL